MKWKCIIIGGLVFWIVTNLLGFATGPIIHNGILEGPYQENANFWVPELREDPPNMAALMPIWLLNSLILSLVVAWLYCGCKCCDGPGWKCGLRFGLGLAIFVCALYRSWSGVFDLPSTIWVWWCIETFVMYLIGGAAMGWAVAKWGGD